MRIERLWVGRSIAFVADFQTCSSLCQQRLCHKHVFPQYVCAVIALSSQWLHYSQWKNKLRCICLIVQNLVASGTKTFATPRPKFFFQNVVVPFFSGADLCEPKVCMAMPFAVLSCRSFSQGLSWVCAAKLLGATESSAPVSTKIFQVCLGDLQARVCCSKFSAGCCSPSPKLLLLAVAASCLVVSKFAVCGAFLHYFLRRSWLGSPWGWEG